MKDLITGGLALFGAYKLAEHLGYVKPKNAHCPTATQDIGVNTRNRQIAIDRFMYGPLNPALPSDSYWKKLASVWSRGGRITENEIREAKSARCGNCGVFDVSPGMRKCLPPIDTSDDYDRFAVETDAVLGYCWAHHFKCASTRTCKTWVSGGPIKSDSRSPLRKEK
jgi:hypothetical protein|tara:strand:+ start:400 stop:900 length:501 start_codon:yes stop_codon:yes gene_type:complete